MSFVEVADSRGGCCISGWFRCSTSGDVDLPLTPPMEPGRRPVLLGAVYPGVILKPLPQFETFVSFEVCNLGEDSAGFLGDRWGVPGDISGESDRIKTPNDFCGGEVVTVAVCLPSFVVTVLAMSVMVVLSPLSISAFSSDKSTCSDGKLGIFDCRCRESVWSSKV